MLFYGGEGDDRYIPGGEGGYFSGGDGLDTIDFRYAAAGVTYTTGIETEYVDGSSLGDMLFGAAGDDRLDGGLAADYLRGDAGADQFMFASALGGGNVDRIADYETGSDRILLDDSVFAGPGQGFLSDSAFAAGTAAQDSDDRIVYDQATGAIWWDADGSGSGAAELFAWVAAGTALSAGDFVIV